MPKNPQAEAYFKCGVDFYKKTSQADYLHALAEFKKVVALNPENFEAWWYIGQCHRNIKAKGDKPDCSAAAEAFAQGVKANPDYAYNYAGLAEVLKVLGNYAEAKVCYEKASTLEPKFYQSHYYLANLLLLSGEHAKALEYARKCFALAPKYPEAGWLQKIEAINSLFKEGVTLYDKKPSPDFIHALPKFQEVVKLNPNNFEAWWYIGQCHRNIKLADGNFDNLAAAEAFSKSIAANPNYFNGYNGLGLALGGLKKFREAKDAFSKAKELLPAHDANLLQLSLCHSYLGDSLKALENATEMNRINPRRDPTWFAKTQEIHAKKMIADDLFNKKEYAKALVHFQALTTLAPDNPSFWAAAGNCYHVISPANDLASAEAYSKSIHLNPENAYSYYGLGLALYAINKIKEARIAFNKASELIPSYYQSHYHLSRCFSTLGDNAKALEWAKKMHQFRPDYDPDRVRKFELINQTFREGVTIYDKQPHDFSNALPKFQEVIKLNPYSFEAWCYIGECHKHIKAKDDKPNYPAAAEAFAKCIKLNPDYAYGYSGLGDALANMGQVKEAIVAYKKASELEPNFYQNHYYLSCSLAQVGRNAEALKYAKKMQSIAPNYQPTWLSEIQAKVDAIGHFNTGNYKTALPLFEQYAKNHPTHQDIWWYKDHCPQSTKIRL